MTAPKKPQDHKSKAVDDKPEGWELLKPFDQIPAWDQAEVIAAVSPLAGNVSFSDPVAMKALGEMARALLPCAVDPAAMTSFLSGREGLTRSAELASYLAGQLGESERSTSS